MTIENISLREIKKARTKLALYESAMTLMKDQVFQNVMVEQICRHAEVSRVTFFKFFPKKEDVLIYFMHIWLTEQMIEIVREQKKGFAVIRHLLLKVAELTEETSGLMPSLISFLAQMKMHPRLPKLGEAEVYLLFPQQIEIGSQTPDMYELFYRAMQEAEQLGELKPGVSVSTAVKVMFTIFYGSFLTAQQYASDDILGFYELHLQLLERKEE